MAEAQNIETKTTEKVARPVRASKKTQKEFFAGTGRRKSAVARVWLYPEKGEITINDKNIKDVFTSNSDIIEWVRPFHSVGVSHPQAKFSATIKIIGGGTASWVEAVKLGIARALLAYDPSFKAILRANGLLTRDSREKERKKPFFRKARKKPQYSKR